MQPLASVVPFLVRPAGPVSVTATPESGLTPSSSRRRTARLPWPPPDVPGGAATRLFWTMDGALRWPSQVTVEVTSRLYDRALEIVQVDWAVASATHCDCEVT